MKIFLQYISYKGTVLVGINRVDLTANVYQTSTDMGDSSANATLDSGENGKNIDILNTPIQGFRHHDSFPLRNKRK